MMAKEIEMFFGLEILHFLREYGWLTQRPEIKKRWGRRCEGGWMDINQVLYNNADDRWI